MVMNGKEIRFWKDVGIKGKAVPTTGRGSP